MSNVVPQQYQQQASTNGANSGSQEGTYQQQHVGGNYSYAKYGPSYWNGGYTNNQPGNYYAGATSQQASSVPAAAYPRSNWYSKPQQRQQNCYTQHPSPVATSNHGSMKRAYSTDAVLHDITNGTNAPKRRKMAPINTTHVAQVLPKDVHRNTAIASNLPASSIDDPTRKVRIESIFRHVELLAQSYWQTGKRCSAAATTLKPTTVDAFEGGMPTPR